MMIFRFLYLRKRRGWVKCVSVSVYYIRVQLYDDDDGDGDENNVLTQLLIGISLN